MKFLFLLLVSASCLFACNKQRDTKSEDANKLTVALGNCEYVDSVGMPPTVCFEQLLEESRCPANANCVWQGVAVGKFSFRLSGVSHQLVLATTKYPGRPSTDTVVAGYRVKLVNITPYPGMSTEPTRAILQITR